MVGKKRTPPKGMKTKATRIISAMIAPLAYISPVQPIQRKPTNLVLILIILGKGALHWWGITQNNCGTNVSGE